MTIGAVGKGKPNIEEILKADTSVEVPEGWCIGEVKDPEFIHKIVEDARKHPCHTSYAAKLISEDTVNGIRKLMNN